MEPLVQLIKKQNDLKTRVFIWEFVWTKELIKHIIDSCDINNIEICGWGIRSKDFQKMKEVWPIAPIFEAPLPFDKALIKFNCELADGFSFEQEENITYLLDREGKYQNNMHADQMRYEINAWVLHILEYTNPDWILFPDVPHNIFTYLLYLNAQKHGVRVQMIRRGLTPNLFLITRTIERDFPKELNETHKINLSPHTLDFLEAFKRDSDTSPYYMKEQRKNSKFLQILKRSIAKGSDLFTRKSFGAIHVHFNRKKLKKFYESICDSSFDLPNTKPYIVVFLQLQPERSTNPEGGVFAQQWLVVQMLSRVCSENGWKIYVKEHPSTFMTGPKLYRGEWFYNGLMALPNVSLISTSVDSIKLLKKAKAVATVTGTVGLEAVTNGIPALLFGESPFFGCEGTFRIRNYEDLKKAISSINDGIIIDFNLIKRFFSAWENDERSYNTELFRNEDHTWHMDEWCTSNCNVYKNGCGNT